MKSQHGAGTFAVRANKAAYWKLLPNDSKDSEKGPPPATDRIIRVLSNGTQNVATADGNPQFTVT